MKKVCVKISAAVVALIVAFFSLVYPAARVGAVENNAMTYYVYDAQGKYKYTYSLPKVATLLASQSREAFQDDSRVVDFTKSGVCRVSMAGGSGTGFVVDSHTIATAAHIVYDIEYAGRPSETSKRAIGEISFYNANGVNTLTLGPLNVKEVHVPKLFYDNNRVVYRGTYDYALITVNTDLSDYHIFNLGYLRDSVMDWNHALSCTGFPGTVRDDDSGNTMYTAAGRLTSLDSLTMYHNIDTSRGNSGSPMYLTTRYGNKVYYTVIGIHVGSVEETVKSDKHRGVRITTDVLHFYKNNPNK